MCVCVCLCGISTKRFVLQRVTCEETIKCGDKRLVAENARCRSRTCRLCGAKRKRIRSERRAFPSGDGEKRSDGARTRATESLRAQAAALAACISDIHRERDDDA